MPASDRPAQRLRRLAGIAASAVLLGLYAKGGLAWPLGFVALVPWLLSLDLARSAKGVLLDAVLLAMAFVAGVFGWFATAISAYTGTSGGFAFVVLVLLGPLLQPQVLAFALVRHGLTRRRGPLWGMLGGVAAWVACEALWPKLFGDTLGHGLQPSETLRQAADLGGAHGLTALLLLSNAALALVLERRHAGWRAWWKALALTMLVPLALAGYGLLRLSALQQVLQSDADVPALRVGLVQSALVDYDRRRREHGTFAVVRQILDTHFAMSHAAVQEQGAEALLWSETVYPTTYGQPQSEDGAGLDREIQDFVAAAGVPLVFGTYERDREEEYNAAVVLDPRAGLLGRYRKTYPFPLTEHVPAWLDGPGLRRWLPWTGRWQPGDGARVFPLRTADGRELNVLPLICLDAVAPQLAIDGARLGAQAIVSLSNDAWFSAAPQGARLHLAVAAFRSIETRMPQVRVTSNGLSALIDLTGEVVVQTRMGDQALLVGAVPIRTPPSTLMVRCGNWVGYAALAFLGLQLLAGGLGVGRTRPSVRAPALASQTKPAAPGMAAVVLLTPLWGRLIAGLRVIAAGGLAWLAWRMLTIDGLQVNSLLQLKWYAASVLAPLLAVWGVRRAFRARLQLLDRLLVVHQATQRIEIPLARIARVSVWHWSRLDRGIDVQLEGGTQPCLSLGTADLGALLRTLGAQLPERLQSGSASALPDSPHWGWLSHGAIRFGVFPLLLALPAFRLHQHIAFGGTFGELYTYGLWAWLLGLLIWWGAWSLGLMLWASVLRIGIELGCALGRMGRTPPAALQRRLLETTGHLLYYLAVPLWLALRLL